MLFIIYHSEGRLCFERKSNEFHPQELQKEKWENKGMVACPGALHKGGNSDGWFKNAAVPMPFERYRRLGVTSTKSPFNGKELSACLRASQEGRIGEPVFRAMKEAVTRNHVEQ